MRRHLLFLIAVLVAVPACSDDSTSSGSADAADVAAVEATLQAAREALADGDVAAFMEEWTDHGLQQVFYEAGAAFVANSGYYLGARQYALGESSTPTV